LILNNEQERFSLHRKTGLPLTECEPFLILNDSGNADWIAMDMPGPFNTSSQQQQTEWIKNKIRSRADYKDLFPDYNFHTIHMGYVHNNDTLIETESIYFKEPPKPKKQERSPLSANIHIYYFVDRPIYRPGQQVQFKGFVVNSDRAAKNVMQANKKVKVLIDDVEGNTIYEKTFTSNEFGTFSGTFIIPENGSLGLYDLYDSEDLGYGDFSVEAYKKPQLQVRFDSGSKTLPPNQSVTVAGTVSYLSGAPASFCNLNASIQKRKLDKVDYWYTDYTENYYDRSRGEAYLDTILTTDENGKFELSFYSEADTFYWDGSKYPYTLFDISILAKDQTGEATSERALYCTNISPYAVHFYVNRNNVAD
jgi:Large extracellular alpha-helical protein